MGTCLSLIWILDLAWQSKILLNSWKLGIFLFVNDLHEQAEKVSVKMNFHNIIKECRAIKIF